MKHSIQVLVCLGLVFFHVDPLLAQKGDATLFQALKNNDLAATTAALKNGAKVNSTDKQGATPLHWAVKGGKVEIVKVLLAAGAQVSTTAKGPTFQMYSDGSGKTTWQTESGASIAGTPLHWAAAMGRKEIAALLLSKGANVNSENDSHWTPLFLAAKAGNAELVSYLIDKGATVSNCDKMFGSPLHAAGSKAIAESLIRCGAPLNAKCTYYGSPLHSAAHSGHIDVVAYLIERGVKVDELGTWRVTATDITSQVTPLYVAALAGQISVVKLLFAKGADVKFRATREQIIDKATGKTVGYMGFGGGTILHAAAWGGSRDVCEFVLSKGAEMEAKADMPTGRPFTQARPDATPLSLAAQWGNKEAVALLLEKGADVNTKDKNGYTPLDWAGDEETKAILKKHGGMPGKTSTN